MYQKYVDINFKADSVALINTMDVIVRDYIRQGYVLTVRQLYYQLVSKDIVSNTEQSYKRITGLVNDARLAGLIDWAGIEDRTREFITRGRWDSPGQVVRACANQFHMDMWVGQPYRLFVIVEKEALAGVLERTSHKFDTPLLAARGYPSGTVLREFVKDDILPAIEDGQDIVILHLGDHDPSGLDMTRDLEARIAIFAEDEADKISINRIALSMAQIQQFNPPPNPAKTTDARFVEYRKLYGDKSWELDALSPAFLNSLLDTEIQQYIDHSVWSDRADEIEAHKANLLEAADEFDKNNK